jgi:A/G-specific adenine glycosylase
MLQQTRVETAIGYWRRFMEALPTVEALARASEDQVLTLWSGLGYYRRARALVAAARILVDRHGGHFPRTRAELLALPGVGPYTAGAVLSIAFDLPEPLVDGNVIRVLARLFAVRGDVSRARVRRQLWELAAELVPRSGRAGEWNQALMELGARVCLPRDPACGACPLRSRCAAFREGSAARLPELPERPPARPVELLAVLAQRDGELLLERRAERGRMAGMWQLPTAELPGPDGRHSGLFPLELPGGLAAAEELARLRHSITCHRITLRICRAGPPGEPRRAARELAWVPRERVFERPLTGMARKALRLPILGGV